jgi:hypothetical protein
MVNMNGNSKTNLRKIMFNALKATLKGAIFYVLYFVLWMFLAPVAEIVPGFQQSFETFVAVYVALIVIGELTSNTIFQHFFNTAKELFVILYLILALKGGMISVALKDVNLMVDLRFFLVIAMLLSLLGLAKSVLQAINYMNQKVEYERI